MGAAKLNAMTTSAAPENLIDSRYAAWRLLVTLGLMTLGGSCMYVVAVVLPAVQAEFGVSRADASMPYTVMMLAFGLGGIFMGRLADRAGVKVGEVYEMDASRRTTASWCTRECRAAEARSARYSLTKPRPMLVKVMPTWQTERYSSRWSMILRWPP